jgi:hypothetical protein
MAKHQNNPDPAEVVIFFARARGGGALVAESVRALADAVDRAAQPRPPVRIVRALPADAKPAERSLLDTAEETDTSNGDEGAANTLDAPAPGDSRRKRGDGDPKDRNASIALVGDVDFVPNGKTSLKNFFAEKAPGSDMDHVLVLCHFLQHTLQYTKFGPGHILSGFKHVGKPVPKDLKGTIRNMKKDKAWLNFTDIESLRLTTEGDNRVEHELGKGNSGGE